MGSWGHGVMGVMGVMGVVVNGGGGGGPVSEDSTHGNPGPDNANASDENDLLAGLNPAQREAVLHGAGSAPGQEAPLLIIAGAGTGKTKTLAHRVAQSIRQGRDPRRLLLLTFSRRAAREMTRRALRLCQSAPRSGGAGGQARAPLASTIPWSGTFHAVANRLLRLHGTALGLDPSFTVLDRADSADLLDLARSDLGFDQAKKRFPRKNTCLSIYSYAVNAECSVEEAISRHFPWCEDWEESLRRLFGTYVERKQAQNVLDYDDLLLYWAHLMEEEALAAELRARFDHVFVDEYQDTNPIQARILMGLAPGGRGLTVVGDDAQSIYSFRAATVRNILDFPESFTPPARVVTLERNYRSTRPILAACNDVIALASERYAKNLASERASAARPRLVTVADEGAQVDWVVERTLELRESGIDLQRQAVLFRAAHHSDALEVELARRNIPFVKFGGLRFLEAAHVKDLLCVLRLAENPRDAIAAFRVFQLLPGIGPAHARRAATHLELAGHSLGSLDGYRPPAAAALDWHGLCELLLELGSSEPAWPGQLGRLRDWYRPHLERLYDAAPARDGDLEQLEQLAGAFPNRERFLAELTLDPPDATSDEAGPPRLDEDYLVLSTIHSAKGQEWDAVTILNVSDGSIPSDMATRDESQIEEERRLLYVAMTRARDHLALLVPQRFYTRGRSADPHVYAARSRFLPDSLLPLFERESRGLEVPDDPAAAKPREPRLDVAAKLRAMWS